jgi:outer membrane protein TolC
MQSTVLAVICLFAGQAVTAADTGEESLTLEEAVRLSVERYPDVAKARAGADVLKGKIREVRSQALPDVAFNFNYMRWRDPSLLNASGIDQFPPELRNALVPKGVNLFDYHISVKQPLYTAGKVGTALRIASVEAEGALADIDRAEQDVAMAVVRAFYGLLWAEGYLGLVTETREQRRQHAEMARTRFQNGVATEVDVLRSEVALANSAPEVLRAQNDIRQARALLNFYLVRPIDTPTRIRGAFEERPWNEGDLDALVREASRRRPELNRARIAERSAGAQLELAQAESRLKVDFTGNYGMLARLSSSLLDRDFVRWTLGFNVTLPLFDGFRRSGLVEQATAGQRSTRLEREKLEEQVRLGLQQGLDDLAAARETVAAARANIQQAEKVLEMTQNNYKYGAATTLDIVDAQTALSVARTNLLRGLHDYAVARANLRWTAGMKPWE